MGAKGVKLDHEHFEEVSRGEWGARPPIAVEPLEPPIAFVVVHYTNTKTCKTRQECVQAMQELQRQHMDEKNLIDIKYNFIIGGDGSVYEGRGWNAQGLQTPLIHETFAGSQHFDTIDIAFIGTCDDVEYTEIMRKTYDNFVKASQLKVLLRMDLYTVITEQCDPETKAMEKEERDKREKRRALRRAMQH